MDLSVLLCLCLCVLIEQGARKELCVGIDVFVVLSCFPRRCLASGQGQMLCSTKAVFISLGFQRR